MKKKKDTSTQTEQKTTTEVLTQTESMETIQEHKEDMSQEGLNIKDRRDKLTEQKRDNLRSSFIKESRGKIDNKK